MLSETTLDLAEKFRQNWQTQYPYLTMEKYDSKAFQPNFPKRNHRNMNTNGFSTYSNNDIEDDSLTNLNWLQVSM